MDYKGRYDLVVKRGTHGMQVVGEITLTQDENQLSIVADIDEDYMDIFRKQLEDGNITCIFPTDAKDQGPELTPYIEIEVNNE